MTEKKTFYLTFGQKSPARNGWIEVRAKTYEDARRLVDREYKQDWSMLYSKNNFSPAYFPSGRLGILQ